MSDETEEILAGSATTWLVTCLDADRRPTRAFASLAEAQDWAEWGHFCTRRHSIEEKLFRVESAATAGIVTGQAIVTGSARGAWRIEDLSGAEWAMRKLRSALAELDELDKQAKAWRDEVDDWFARASKSAGDTVARMRWALEWWALRERERSGAKSQALPSGVVRTRQGSARVEITDEAAAVAWLEEHASSDDLAALTRRRLSPEQLRAALIEVPAAVVIEPCGHPCIPDPGWPMESGEDAPCTVCGTLGRIVEVAAGDEVALPASLHGCPGLVVEPGSVSVTVTAHDGPGMGMGVEEGPS